ncbi:MAG: aldose 1-epimerase [Devosia sp.]|nr:aldose 1-epimerase [Devosia sp.]
MIELTAGDLSLGIVPEIGGSLAYFRHGGVDLMRRLSAADQAAGNVLGVAMFPMVPYANRIAGNGFDFGGRTWRFAANNPPEHFNVHGTGWHAAWTAERQDGGVLLSLDHLAPDEPYSYRAAQHFSLTPAGLRVRMNLTNRGPVAMPFGFGLHPWFERAADVELTFAASHFFMEGPQGVPSERLATPPELDFSRGRPLPDTWRNNDYGGWDGTATIRYPSRRLGLRIEADPVFGHLMFYADPERPYFCLEPQSNAPCAFNRIASGCADGMGAIVLAPGEAVEGTIGFYPFRL